MRTFLRVAGRASHTGPYPLWHEAGLAVPLIQHAASRSFARSLPHVVQRLVPGAQPVRGRDGPGSRLIADTRLKRVQTPVLASLATGMDDACMQGPRYGELPLRQELSAIGCFPSTGQQRALRPWRLPAMRSGEPAARSGLDWRFARSCTTYGNGWPLCRRAQNSYWSGMTHNMGRRLHCG